MKKLFCLIMAAALMLTLTACGNGRNNTDLSVYAAAAEEQELLPALSELGEYEAVQSLHHHDSALFFEWDAYNLIVSYDGEGYEQAKAAAEERYVFENDPIHSERYVGGPHHDAADDWKPVSYPPTCTIGGYRMRMLDDETYSGISFPKYVCFVGFNDEAHKLAYVYFEDVDLDVADSLEDFLLDECGWSVLIKKNML